MSVCVLCFSLVSTARACTVALTENQKDWQPTAVIHASEVVVLARSLRIAHSPAVGDGNPIGMLYGLEVMEAILGDVRPKQKIHLFRPAWGMHDTVHLFDEEMIVFLRKLSAEEIAGYQSKTREKLPEEMWTFAFAGKDCWMCYCSVKENPKFPFKTRLNKLLEEQGKESSGDRVIRYIKELIGPRKEPAAKAP